MTAGMWTSENVPPVLLNLISAAAGKEHHQGGAVAQNLADVLNTYDALREEWEQRPEVYTTAGAEWDNSEDCL